MGLLSLPVIFEVIGMLLLVSSLLLLVSSALAQQEGDVVGVAIQENYFDPADIEVNPRAIVEWVNKSENPHSITADNELFDSGPLEPGETYWVVLAGQGKVTYLNSPEMSGTITVGEESDEEAKAAKKAPASANGADGIIMLGTRWWGRNGGNAIGGAGGDGVDASSQSLMRSPEKQPISEN
jgi:plastocyanin